MNLLKKPKSVMSEQKLLYVMNVPWSWLKQRPHFLAFYLSLNLPVIIFYRRSGFYFSKTTDKKPKNLISIFQLPLTRFLLISCLNDWIFEISIRKHVRVSSFVLLQSPHDYYNIKNHLSSTTQVVYDCMDDLLEFHSIHGESKEKLMLKEKSLTDRANFIFASSNYLKNKLMNRYKCKSQPRVINNAIDASFLVDEVPVRHLKKIDSLFEILYIGTISEWFDFDLILTALNRFDSIRFVLIGVSVVKIPYHERLIFRGRLAHSDLPLAMSEADALIMPFKITELVKSVNPVKLYEYIVNDVPIITCDYDEISVFYDFVYTYSSVNVFLELIERLINGSLIVKTREERFRFLQENTWHSRAKEMSEVLLGTNHE